MAQNPDQGTSEAGFVQPVITPQHFSPPTARELRAQAVHRLQVGLFGLAAMLLIVGLANIVMEPAREAEVADPAMEEVQPLQDEKKPAADPLADIGVAPAAEPVPTLAPTPIPTMTGLPTATATPNVERVVPAIPD